MNFLQKFLPVFEADGGAGGAPSSAPSGGAAPAAGGAGGPSGGATTAPIGAPGAQDNSGGWRAPDFLPDHLRGKDVGETFARVAEDWKGLRDRVAQTPAPGKTVAEYAFTPSEKSAPFLGDLANDPVLAVSQEAALKAGLSPKQFSDFVGQFYDTLADAGKLPQPYDAARERAALIGPDARFMSEAQQVEAVRPVLEGAARFLDGLKTTGELTPEAHALLGAQLDTAAGAKAIAAIAKLFAANGPRGLAMGGEAGGAGRPTTAADLRARQRDARNDPDSASFDRGFREKTQQMYREYYGD